MTNPVTTIGTAVRCAVGGMLARTAGRVAALGLAVGLAGCSGDTTGAAPAVPGTYVALVLNERAINMSVDTPANTLQLVAVPRDALGAPIQGLPVVTFRGTDSTVTVTPTGVVTAHYPTGPGGTRIIATLQVDNITHTDTAAIRVTQHANPGMTAPLQTFSIQPAATDSAVRAYGSGAYTPNAVGLDQLGNTVAFNSPAGSQNIYASWASNPVILKEANASYFDDAFFVVDTGHVTIYAQSWVYGVSVRDSLQFFAGWPLTTSINTIFNTGTPLFIPDVSQLRLLGIGGVIQYLNGGDGASVVFSDSTVVDSAATAFLGIPGTGNIHFPNDGQYHSAARTFPVAGTYHFWNPNNPTVVGTLIILTNPQR